MLQLPQSDSASPSILGRFLASVANWTTFRMFREDKRLAALTGALALSALAPIFVTPILPLVDLGSNVGASGLLIEAATGDGVVAHHYWVQLALVPYWTVYLALAFFNQLLGPFAAAKIVSSGAIVCLPIAVMRLLYALGRSPRAGLLAFALVWDTNAYWGWITFQWGMCFALFAIARLYEVRSAREALRVLPTMLLISITHVHAIALTLLAGGVMAFAKRPLRAALHHHAIALSGCLLGVLPWLVNKLRKVGGQPSSFTLHTLQEKVLRLFEWTLDNQPQNKNLSLLALVLLLASPLLLAALPGRKPEGRHTVAAWLFLCSPLLLYLALPFAIDGPVYHWWTYPRFATYVLVGLLTLAAPRLQGRALLALLPGLLVTVAVHSSILEQFKKYGDYVRPYLAIVDSLPNDTRFFPLDADDYRFKGTKEASLGQLHGYAAAAKSSYDPHLFDEPNNPLRFRRKRMLPVVNWSRQLASFRMKNHGRYYDYIIVHPTNRDPIAKRASWRRQVELVRESGPWRLYKVKNPRPVRR